MNTNRIFNKINTLIIIILSISIIILGTSVIFGWLTHNLTLIQLYPRYVSMKFNTSLLFLLIGLSLLFVLNKKKISAGIIGLFILLISGLTFAQYVFNIDLLIDQLFVNDYYLRGTSNPGRMAPNTALCFIFISFNLIIYSFKPLNRNFNIILALFNTIVFGLSSVALIGYFIGLESAYGWGEWTKMALHTSIGLIVTSLAFIIWLWNNLPDKHRFTSSIQLRLIFRIIPPIVLVYLLHSIFNINQLIDISKTKTDAELTKLSYQLSERIDEKINEIKNILQDSQKQLQIGEDLKEESIYKLLENIVLSDSLIYGSALIFDEFKFNDSTRLLAPYVYKPNGLTTRLDIATSVNYLSPDIEWFNKPASLKKAVWMDPYFDEGVTDLLLCSYCVPIFQDKELWAVITFDLDLMDLTKHMKIDSSKELEYFIVSTSGYFIYNSVDSNYLGKNFHDINYEEQLSEDVVSDLKSIFHTKSSGKYDYFNQNDEEYWMYYIPLVSVPWKVYVRISESQAVEQVRIEILRQLIALLLVVSIFTIIIISISRKITVPIKILNEAVKKLAEGDNKSIINIQSGDEVGELANSFNSMTYKLTEREASLRESEERLSFAFKSSVSGLWDYNISTKTNFLSSEYYQILGYENQEFEPSYEKWKSMVHPDDLRRVENAYDRYLNGASQEYNIEYRIQLKSKSYIWITDQSNMISRDEDSNVLRVTGVIRNINEKKLNEQKKEELLHDVGERIKELNCLYELHKFTEDTALGMDEILQKIVDVIPPTWQYPEFTCSRVSFKGNIYVSKDFEESKWVQKQDIVLEDIIVGSIEVFYLKEMPQSDLGPFMKEERGLLEAIVKQIVNFYLRKNTEKDLLKSYETLEDKVRERTIDLEEAKEKELLILESAGEGILGVDNMGVTSFVNNAALRMLGYNSEEIIGERIHDLVHYKHEDGSIFPMEDCPMYITYKEGNTNHIDNEVLWKKDGTSFPVDYTSMPIIKNGACVGAVITFSDITERKMAESRLRLSSYALDNASDTIFLIDADSGKLDYANERASKTLGYSRDELLDLTLFDIDPTMNKENWRKLVNTISSKESSNFESINVSKEGVEFPIEVSATYLDFDESNNILAFTRNISKRKESEGEMKKLLTAVEQNPIIVTIISPDGICEYVNPEYIRTTGYKEEEVIGKIHTIIKNAGLSKAQFKEIQGVAQKNETWKGELETKKFDGGNFWVSISVAGVKDENDQLKHLILIEEDITERKKVEAKVLEAKNRTDAILSSSTNGIITISENGLIETFNPAAESIFGYNNAEVIGENVRLLMTEDHSVDHDNYLAKYLKTGIKNFIGKTRLEVNAKRKSGDIFPVEIGISEVQLPSGRLFTAIVNDISERKKMQLDLEQKLDELERFNKLTIGREITMIELKKEINTLLLKSGSRKKYKIVKEEDFD